MDQPKLYVEEEAELHGLLRPYDPEQPIPSRLCAEDKHEQCDQFGWIPWCQCDCHVPWTITGVCYHGRHDLCPPQPPAEKGPRCTCWCHKHA